MPEIEEIEFHEENQGKKICGSKEQSFDVGLYIRYVFFFFMIVWTFIVTVNKFYFSAAFPILLIPYASFGLGFINSDAIADDNIEEGVFSATFITMGLVISLPLLSYINNKILGDSKEVCEKKSKKSSELNHIIFLAMIATLFSYIHIWVDQSGRHVCKIIRSCFETIAVTLYIFALVIFFILT